MATPLFPLFLKLSGRRVLLVGAGTVAAEKLRHLLDAGADVTVVAPAIAPAIANVPVTTIAREFLPSDLDGVWLVVSAAPAAVNRQVAAAAAERQIFVNAVDDIECASAYAAAVLRRDRMTVAISTDGEAPALAGLFREAIDALIPRDLADWFAASRRARADWLRDRVPMRHRRPLLLQVLNRLYESREGLGFAGGSQGSVEAAPEFQGDRGVLASPRSPRSPCESEALPGGRQQAVGSRR